jgi:hypothetical protein
VSFKCSTLDHKIRLSPSGHEPQTKGMIETHSKFIVWNGPPFIDLHKLFKTLEEIISSPGNFSTISTPGKYSNLEASLRSVNSFGIRFFNSCSCLFDPNSRCFLILQEVELGSRTEDVVTITCIHSGF